jgi:hypothetical protein
MIQEAEDISLNHQEEGELDLEGAINMQMTLVHRRLINSIFKLKNRIFTSTIERKFNHRK